MPSSWDLVTIGTSDSILIEISSASKPPLTLSSPLQPVNGKIKSYGTGTGTWHGTGKLPFRVLFFVLVRTCVTSGNGVCYFSGLSESFPVS